MHHQEHERIRLHELDALRGLAALGVLLFHFTGHFERLYGHSVPLPFAFEIGDYGVHLFFVISGFVIFMTLERTRHAFDFVVSRFSRLFPAYWAALALTLVAVKTDGLSGQQVSTQDAIINLSMLADLFQAREVDGSYWTLQVELLFYVQMLFWFWIGWLPRIRVIIVGWLLLALAYGIFARLDEPLSYLLRELTIVRFIPFFAAGILLYRIHRARDSIWQNALLLLACIAVTWVLWSWNLALALAICEGIFLLFIFDRLSFLSRRVFLFFGGISYTMYLVHQNIGYIEIAHLERAGVHPLASIGIALATIIVLAWFLRITVEQPVMQWIRSNYKHWQSTHPRSHQREA